MLNNPGREPVEVAFETSPMLVESREQHVSMARHEKCFSGQRQAAFDFVLDWPCEFDRRVHSHELEFFPLDEEDLSRHANLRGCDADASRMAHLGAHLANKALQCRVERHDGCGFDVKDMISVLPYRQLLRHLMDRARQGAGGTKGSSGNCDGRESPALDKTAGACGGSSLMLDGYQHSGTPKRPRLAVGEAP